MMRMTRRLLDAEDGATAVEYGILVAFVSLGLIASLAALGGSLESVLTLLSGTLDVALGGGTP
jgi:pilus assembly protein Flp/PilA